MDYHLATIVRTGEQRPLPWTCQSEPNVYLELIYFGAGIDATEQIPRGGVTSINTGLEVIGYPYKLRGFQ